MENSVNSNQAVLSLHNLADPIFLSTVQSLYNTPCYAPNFGKVEGAYCFGLVRLFFFKVWIISLCGVMPLLKGHNDIF